MFPPKESPKAVQTSTEVSVEPSKAASRYEPFDETCWQTKAEIPEDCDPGFTHYESNKLAAILLEVHRRKNEALRLYEPMALQAAFHASMAKERSIRGSNRSGKTLGAAVECARAVTGQDPYGKWPLEDGRFFICGFDGKHLAHTIYHYLFEPDAFSIIRDEVTGLWRAFKPWTHDVLRSNEKKSAPPLIPARFVRDVAWENKAQRVPTVIRLTTGWELHFFSSNAKPPQGVKVDGYWFDEEVGDQHYPEARMRLVDKQGRFVWSATPQVGNTHLYELHERAESESLTESPRVAEFVALIDDNVHLSAEDRRDISDAITSDEERRVRIKGEFLVTSFRVYPDFSLDVHGWKPDDPAAEASFPPADWTRYAVLDPGHTYCATLLAAVPPADQGDFVYIYDELVVKQCTAEKWADAFVAKVGIAAIQEMLIDHQAGRQTSMATGKSHEQHYLEALAAKKWRSIKPGFTWGANDIKAGLEAVRRALQIRSDGTTKLRILKGRCPEFERQMRHYHKKRVNKVVVDEPLQKDCDLPDCLRYLLVYNPKHVKPSKAPKPESAIQRYLKAKALRRATKDGDHRDFISVGPTSTRGLSSLSA